MLNPKSHQVKSDMTTDNTSERDDGGPAYPHTGEGLGREFAVPGMSLRDYFAAKAMAEVMAQPANRAMLAPDVVTIAYAFADAMLKARKQ